MLFIMIVCQERAQSDYIRRNVKNKCSKIASLFEFSMMFCFGGFRYNEWARVQWVRVHTLTKGTARNMT